MTKNEAFGLFEFIFKEAENELYRFTRSMPLGITHKADNTVVTACDIAINARIAQIITDHGLSLVSEEGTQSEEVVKRGTYCTIDPIDGTLEYIRSVNGALSEGGVEFFLQSKKSKDHNFCLLVGLVENGVAVYGGCYNYVTGEKFLIDANSKHVIRRNIPTFIQEIVDPVIYVDPRIHTDSHYKLLLNKIIGRIPNAIIITQGSFGLNALHALLNDSSDALVFHPVQQSGLWDILPAAVVAHAFGGEIFDGQGKQLELTSYNMIPGRGLYVIKGEKFKFVIYEI